MIPKMSVYSIKELEFCFGRRCMITKLHWGSQECNVKIVDIVYYNDGSPNLHNKWIVTSIPEYDKIRGSKLAKMLIGG